MPWSRGVVYGCEKEVNRNAEIWLHNSKSRNNSTPNYARFFFRRAIVLAVLNV